MLAVRDGAGRGLTTLHIIIFVSNICTMNQSTYTYLQVVVGCPVGYKVSSKLTVVNRECKEYADGMRLCAGLFMYKRLN